MKILFMGGKRVGCGCLEYIIQTGHEVVGVVVNPGDTAADRWYPSAAELALKHAIPVFQWKRVNHPDVVKILQRLALDMIVVVYYDQILKREIIQIPRLGCINLHLALAEEYRGCYPTTWAIINGETRTGVTIHYIDESIDGGDILAQKEVPIDDDETGLSLYEKCTDAGIALFGEVFLDILDQKIKPRSQDGTRGRYYKRVFPDRKIDFTKSGPEIYRFIRALLFEPFDPPFFCVGNQKYEIRKVKDSGGFISETGSLDQPRNLG